MSYEWQPSTTGRSYELREITKTDIGSPDNPMGWDSYYPVGRLRKIKNKISCKKFALERFEYGSWEYITLLCMKLDEAKEIARTILIAGANND